MAQFFFIEKINYTCNNYNAHIANKYWLYTKFAKILHDTKPVHSTYFCI